MTRRDGYGRYLVLPPGGVKPQGYTRVTTIAKTLDDSGGLLPWKATMAVVGTMRRPGLRGQWEALLAEHSDPWYSDAESKKRCKRLVEECAEAGGSADRAEIGTSLHALVEQINKGQTPVVSQESTRADLAAYQAAVAAAGIHIDPAMCERIVVLDGYNVAGTADMLRVKVPGLGDVVADLKTGANLDFGWQAIAVQLAAYAHADAIYEQGETAGDDQRLAMPDVSKEWGLVIHLPAGEARCTLHLVDLVAGWEAFKLSLEVRKWRSRKGLHKPFAAPAAVAAPVVVEDDFDAPKVTPASTPAPPTPAEQKAALPGTPDEGPMIDDASYEALKRRFDAMSPSARVEFKAIAQQALRASVPFQLSSLASLRRFELGRAVVQICEHEFDAEAVRSLVALALDSDAAHFPSVTLGHAIGALDAEQATRFAQLVDALVDGRLAADIDAAGVLRFVAA